MAVGPGTRGPVNAAGVPPQTGFLSLDDPDAYERRRATQANERLTRESMTADRARQADLDRRAAGQEEYERNRQIGLDSERRALVASQLQTTTGYTAPPAGGGGGAPVPGGTSGTPGGGAPLGAGGPVGSATPSYDPAADAATYGRAKESTGMAMQAALRGLREAMASRGISGSGIEARGTADIFGQGVGALAETDRQLAEGTASRGFTAGESARNRNEGARQFNVSAGQREREMGLNEQARRLSNIFSLYGAY